MNKLKSYIKTGILGDLLSNLDSIDASSLHKSEEYLEWINSDLVEFAEEFVVQNQLLDSVFIKGMNSTFNTKRFEYLLKRWLIEYMLKLFMVMDQFVLDGSSNKRTLALEDNPINRFAVKKYSDRFKIGINIKWLSPAPLLKRYLIIVLHAILILALTLKKGVKFSGKKKKYKVMRETLWGLYDTGGYYFHDDFFIDGNKIKNEDLLLFSRPSINESFRIKASFDAKKSPYEHCYLASIRIGLNEFFARIIPKYVVHGNGYLLCHIKDRDFSLLFSIYRYFVVNAIPYEKVFSNYELVSELGHSYFSATHVVDSIICQDLGVRYYLMHWSDISLKCLRNTFSFLSCDKFLLWGLAHVNNKEIDTSILLPIGYVFKKFINEIKASRDRIALEMGIKRKGKIVSFFDEPFGEDVRMTQGHFITFWETILKVANLERDNTVVVKPKGEYVWGNLTGGYKRRFDNIRSELSCRDNVYFVDPNRWSFIEAIGISDLVVTQGMTSSATIAIVSGIEGLYLDQAGYDHPFSKRFKDIIVFDIPERLILRIQKFLTGSESIFGVIPEDLLCQFDTYPDDNGIERLRDILLGKESFCDYKSYSVLDID